MERTSKVLMILAFCLAPAGVPSRAAEMVTAPLNNIKVYPNPWRADEHMNVMIKFDNMPAASVIKIFTVSGRQVRSLVADSNGSAAWDRNNDSGEKVASGVYLFLAKDPHGNEIKGKLAIIR